MPAEMGQTILVRLGVVEQVQVHMNLKMMNQYNESRAQTSKLWWITHNNMRAFDARIKSALV